MSFMNKMETNNLYKTSADYRNTYATSISTADYESETYTTDTGGSILIRVPDHYTTKFTPKEMEKIEKAMEKDKEPPRAQTYGWICPVCGRGNAPWNSSCDCHYTKATINCNVNK